MTTLTIHTDGGARGNPGPAAIGVAIKTEHNDTVVTISKAIGIATNNVAEYYAVIEALEWLKKYKQNGGHLTAHFYLDSELVVRQITGKYKVKNQQLKILVAKIHLLQSELSCLTIYSSIPRDQNKEADALVNRALDEL